MKWPVVNEASRVRKVEKRGRQRLNGREAMGKRK